jgi:hypothetical protein
LGKAALDRPIRVYEEQKTTNNIIHFLPVFENLIISPAKIKVKFDILSIVIYE